MTLKSNDYKIGHGLVGGSIYSVIGLQQRTEPNEAALWTGTSSIVL